MRISVFLNVKIVLFEDIQHYFRRRGWLARASLAPLSKLLIELYLAVTHKKNDLPPNINRQKITYKGLLQLLPIAHFPNSDCVLSHKS